MELKAPGKLEITLKTDWNSMGVYVMVLGLLTATLIAGAGSTIVDHQVSGLALVTVILGALILAVPLGWLARKLLLFVREGRTFVFDGDSVHIPAMQPFKSPVVLPFEQIEDYVQIRRGYRIDTASGPITIMSDSMGYSRFHVESALHLRFGCVLEKRGRFEEAAEHYNEATHWYEPPLDARLASVYEKMGDIDEALEYWENALWELKDELGEADPFVEQLTAHVKQLNQKNPDADPFLKSDNSHRAAKRERHDRRQAHFPPPLRDLPDV